MATSTIYGEMDRIFGLWSSAAWGEGGREKLVLLISHTCRDELLENLQLFFWIFGKKNQLNGKNTSILTNNAGLGRKTVIWMDEIQL